MRLFLDRRRPPASPVLHDADRRIWIIGGVAPGAVPGSRLASWLADPAAALVPD